MEALGDLKFWRNAGSGDDGISAVEDVRNFASGFDNEVIGGDDLFIDLVIQSPHRGEVLKNDRRVIESPGVVFPNKIALSGSISKPQSPVSTHRPGPKSKAFFPGFRKSPRRRPDPVNQLERSNGPAGKPVASCPFFPRDNSLRTIMLNESRERGASPDVHVAAGGEKVMPKYMKLIKPFYMKGSSKARSSGSSLTPSEVTSNFSPMNLRVASCKIMTSTGKTPMADVQSAPPIRRRDDALLEHHDGIRGAILHCKNSASNSSCQGIWKPWGVGSDNSHERMRRNTREEPKRCSI